VSTLSKASGRGVAEGTGAGWTGREAGKLLVAESEEERT